MEKLKKDKKLSGHISLMVDNIFNFFFRFDIQYKTLSWVYYVSIHIPKKDLIYFLSCWYIFHRKYK